MKKHITEEYLDKMFGDLIDGKYGRDGEVRYENQKSIFIAMSNDFYK